MVQGVVFTEYYRTFHELRRKHVRKENPKAIALSEAEGMIYIDTVARFPNVDNSRADRTVFITKEPADNRRVLPGRVTGLIGPCIFSGRRESIIKRPQALGNDCV